MQKRPEISSVYQKDYLRPFFIWTDLTFDALVMQFRKDVINPFLLDKMAGIQEEEGGYHAFIGSVDLGLFDTLEEANRARIAESSRRFGKQEK